MHLMLLVPMRVKKVLLRPIQHQPLHTHLHLLCLHLLRMLQVNQRQGLS